MCAAQPRANRRSFTCQCVSVECKQCRPPTVGEIIQVADSVGQRPAIIQRAAQASMWTQSEDWASSLVTLGFFITPSPLPPYQQAWDWRVFCFFFISVWRTRFSPINTKLPARWHFLNEAVRDLSAPDEIRSWGFAVDVQWTTVIFIKSLSSDLTVLWVTSSWKYTNHILTIYIVGNYT